MSSFDDLFGSDDEQPQQLKTETAQASQHKTELDELFPDDDDDNDEIVQKSQTTTATMTTSETAKQTMGDDSDDDNDFYVKKPPKDDSFLLKNASSSQTTTTGQDSLAEAADKTSKGFKTGHLQIPVGEPEHFYIPTPAPTRPNIQKEFILLTVPKVVGSATEAYDPETFDYRQALEKLPPFQREYTQGIESMIRWRIVVDPVTGAEKKVSNSRIVHWDNGDIHLQVGTEYFPLSVKGTKIELEKSTDYLFLQSNGLYFHVGNIVSSWKTSIEPTQLADYGPRMQAVKAHLIEMEKNKRTLLTMALRDGQ